jgi:hypothetical protein
MVWKYRTHQKYIQVRSVIGNDDIRPVRYSGGLYFLDVVKTANPHHPTPKNEEFETGFFPLIT